MTYHYNPALSISPKVGQNKLLSNQILSISPKVGLNESFLQPSSFSQPEKWPKYRQVLLISPIFGQN
jgi:hypothetical protein